MTDGGAAPMNPRKILIPALIALAICDLGPWLLTLAGAGAFWGAASRRELGGFVVPGEIFLIVRAWWEGEDRRACRGQKSSHPNEP